MAILLICLGLLSLTIAYVYKKNNAKPKRYIEVKNVAYQQAAKNRAA